MSIFDTTQILLSIGGERMTDFPEHTFISMQPSQKEHFSMHTGINRNQVVRTAGNYYTLEFTVFADGADYTTLKKLQKTFTTQPFFLEEPGVRKYTGLLVISSVGEGRRISVSGNTSVTADIVCYIPEWTEE